MGWGEDKVEEVEERDKERKGCRGGERRVISVLTQ